MFDWRSRPTRAACASYQPEANIFGNEEREPVLIAARHFECQLTQTFNHVSHGGSLLFDHCHPRRIHTSPDRRGSHIRGVLPCCTSSQGL